MKKSNAARRLAHAAAAALPLSLLFASACNRPRVVVVENDAHPAAVEVLVDGESIGEMTGREIRLPASRASRKRSWISRYLFPPGRGELSSALLVRAKTACGPVNFRVRFDDPYGSPSGKEWRAKFSDADLLRPPDGTAAFRELDTVWIDNRGGPPRILTVGSFRYEIAAGEAGHRRVPQAGCPAEQTVTLDGKVVGKIRLASDRPGDLLMEPWPFFLDASGKRCYRMTTFQYGRGRGPWSDELRGGGLHQLFAQRLDHFLERAPESVRAVGGATRTQLVETGC